MKETVESKLPQLPNEPGVYFFKDNHGKIIYVGKAANLRHRVRSYFQPANRFAVGDYKTPVMLGEIADLEWLVTPSEVDALFLESELIKRYKPKFNIELRDDKHYLYVRITTRDQVPTLSFVRRPLDDGATYFGPYVQGFSLRKALRILRKIFPYNTHDPLPKRVCLQYHLGLCPGLEEGKTSLAQYRQDLSKLIMFLKGERSRLIKQLEKEMTVAAKAQKFEQAAQLRNQMRALSTLSRQVVFSDQERFDISRDQALNGLMELLALPGIPRRIEAYDISHLSGTDNVASMIVFIDGVAAKGEYRRFKMRLLGNDDVAHIREVIRRRFSGDNLSKWLKPDLILIDGGKGQLAGALGVLQELGIRLPAIGLAKRREDIIKLTQSRPEILRLDPDSHILKLLQRIRDEAHRFAITYHSLLRSKRQTASTLEEIHGIGPATRKKLIKEFGSLRGVKQASLGQLTQTLGKTKGEYLYQQLSQ